MLETCVFIGCCANFPQRALAAFLAILLRCFAVRLSALAFPPLDAPSFDRATAAGFFMCSGGCSNGVSLHFSPVTLSMRDLANRIGSSLCFFLVVLARVGMVRL